MTSGFQDWLSVDEFRNNLGGRSVRQRGWDFLDSLGARCEVVALCDRWLDDDVRALDQTSVLFDEERKEHYVWSHVLAKNRLLTNLRCRDAKLLLFLDNVFCCMIADKTILPLWLMRKIGVIIRVVVDPDPLRRPYAIRIEGTQEYWNSKRSTDLAKAKNLDCGTFVLQPATQTWSTPKDAREIRRCDNIMAEPAVRPCADR